MSSDRSRFYVVDPESQTHAIIESLNADRIKASKERWKFLEREFPQSKKRKSGWAIVYGESAFGTSSWAIKPPEGEPVPTDWKVDKRDGAWSPRHSTKRGKELAAEMREKKYVLPGAAAIGKAIGCDSVWVGMTLQTIGIQFSNDGRWLLALSKLHKVPQGVARISDIEVERLTEPKPKTNRKRSGV